MLLEALALDEIPILFLYVIIVTHRLLRWSRQRNLLIDDRNLTVRSHCEVAAPLHFVDYLERAILGVDTVCRSL